MGRTVNLGRGIVVPYPEPTTREASAIGRANRRSDTKCEVVLRKELHRLGLRFRKDLLIRADGLRTKADVVFTSVRLAVFVDGCFWHCCPEHFHMPKSNLAYWEPKLRANVERDARATEVLEGDGWTVVRIWEHVPPDVAARDVLQRLRDAGHAGAARLAVAGGPYSSDGGGITAGGEAAGARQPPDLEDEGDDEDEDEANRGAAADPPAR